MTALLIFLVNPFNLSRSLQFSISLQVLQCTFFYHCYVIDNHNVSCCVICLVAFSEASLYVFELEPVSVSRVFKLKKIFLQKLMMIFIGRN